MQDIAEAAGLSMGLLYRYFENKAALIRAFSEIDRGALVGALQALDDGPDFLTRFCRLLRLELAAQLAPGLLKLSTEVMAEACRDEALRESFAASERRLLTVLSELFARQQAAGRIDAGLVPRIAAYLVLALVEGLAVRSFLDRRFARRAAEQALDDALERLLAPRRGSARAHTRPAHSRTPDARVDARPAGARRRRSG